MSAESITKPKLKHSQIIRCSSIRIDVVMVHARGHLADGALGEFMDFFTVGIVGVSHAAQSRNIGVLNCAPMAMGLLNEDGIPDW